MRLSESARMSCELLGMRRGRGRKWQQLIGEGLGLIDSSVRDSTLKIVGAPRSIIPGLDLEVLCAARPT
jgi:hypothetical protein